MKKGGFSFRFLFLIASLLHLNPIQTHFAASWDLPSPAVLSIQMWFQIRKSWIQIHIQEKRSGFGSDWIQIQGAWIWICDV